MPMSVIRALAAGGYGGESVCTRQSVFGWDLSSRSRPANESVLYGHGEVAVRSESLPRYSKKPRKVRGFFVGTTRMARLLLFQCRSNLFSDVQICCTPSARLRRSNCH